ncbi:MBL fold metallo-hydrolase [Caviibacter abscessus]|uniref:MBL fold metallo-hydrolase n=1 Tax=Caviibacter abscessus TaxID=1766719 RepID=UPI001E417D89|nr:MBL fold metallo-hydrolase [Caviibacter abscessus]
MEVKLFYDEITYCNSYLVIRENKECAIIDSGGKDMSRLIEYIKSNNLDLKCILITHGHFDHIIGTPQVLEYKKVPVYVNEKDKEFFYNHILSLSYWIDEQFKLDDKYELSLFNDKDMIFGFECISTPGHTKGSTCFYDKENKVMFTGDTLFNMAYGRTDFPTGDARQLRDSLNKILSMEKDITIYPGHGENSTINQEYINYFGCY